MPITESTDTGGVPCRGWLSLKGPGPLCAGLSSSWVTLATMPLMGRSGPALAASLCARAAPLLEPMT